MVIRSYFQEIAYIANNLGTSLFKVLVLRRRFDTCKTTGNVFTFYIENDNGTKKSDQRIED